MTLQGSKPQIQLVNTNDQPIGCCEYKQARNPGNIRRVVLLLILNQKGNIALQLRSKFVNNPHNYDFSVGGHVDCGETYDQALVREAKEEIGINLTEYSEYKYIKDKVKKKSAFYKIYTTTHEGPFTCCDGEVEQIDWFTPQELLTKMQDPAFPMKSLAREIITEFIEHKTL